MTFKKSNISNSKKRLKTTYTKKVNKKTKKILQKKWKNIFLKIMIYTFLFFVFFWIILSTILYQKYIVWLPPVSELKNLNIAESSVIYDRNWKELYKIFKENRTYVDFEDINKNMINAIVSIEDKRYWTNPWIDIIWLARAWLNYITWNSKWWIAWTSTLTQQLIRNTIITNERSLERKIKEIYLAYKLTSTLSKEKILELYLNKISYWHNAYGIEEAAKTFFNKSAKNLNIFESSILASLPKWPTYYSPYNHQDRIVWYPYIYSWENEKDRTKIITKKDVILHKEILNKFINFISWLKASRLEWTNKTLICWIKKEYFKNQIRVDNDWCSVIEYSWLINFLNSIRIKYWDNYIEYQTWRKDRVLWRMLEDWYIDFKEYKNSILTWIWYKFNQKRENIKAPHFIFFVKEYLEKKYWEKLVNIWWLHIYTTLDLTLQEKAEEIIKNQTKINETKFWARNAAIISLDNKTWEILTMVWSKDYFDKDNKWNVNIITSKLQPWSTFKPFVYSMWIYNKPLWNKSVIYDLETDFWNNYVPANFDWKFMWKINLSTALNNSRNIPAIKMFFMAWWEKNIITFMRKLWVNSLRYNANYWAPLALWTWEMTPLELASAYSIFANLWIKKEITPILKITDSKGNIIEEKKEDKKENRIISEAQSYIINYMLSDSATRPSFWNNYLTLSDRKLAAKTWTSTKQYIKNGKKDIYPANLWTIWYTPQITTVVWAWNTNWEKLKYKWNWLEWTWPIMKNFMEYIHKTKQVENWEKPSSVKEINISNISWLLPNPEKTNPAFITKWLFVNKPTKYDNSYTYVKVDSLCNWEVTKNTPEAAIKTAILIQFNSLMPNNPKWQNPVIKWSQSDKFKKIYWNIPNLITKVNPPCKRSGIPSEIIIKTTIKDKDILYAWENFVQFAYRSNNPIIKVQVLIWDTIVDEVKVNNKKSWSYSWKIFIPITKVNRNTTITLKAIDNEYYSDSVVKNISIKRK